MENGPFIDDFPIAPSIYKGFSMAMLNNQMVEYASVNLHFDPATSPIFSGKSSEPTLRSDRVSFRFTPGWCYSVYLQNINPI